MIINKKTEEVVMLHSDHYNNGWIEFELKYNAIYKSLHTKNDYQRSGMSASISKDLL